MAPAVRGGGAALGTILKSSFDRPHRDMGPSPGPPRSWYLTGSYALTGLSKVLWRVLSAFIASRRFVLASGEFSKASSKAGSVSLTFEPSTRFTFRRAAHSTIWPALPRSSERHEWPSSGRLM